MIVPNGQENSPPPKKDQVENPQAANKNLLQTLLTLFSSDYGKLGAQQDPFAYRSVILVLGLVALFVILGRIGLAAFGKDLPQGILAIGATAIGGLVGLLTPSPRQPPSTEVPPKPPTEVPPNPVK